MIPQNHRQPGVRLLSFCGEGTTLRAILLAICLALALACDSAGGPTRTSETPAPTPTATPIPESFELSCRMRPASGNAAAFVPDPTCTPGAFDPSVTQENYFGLLCFPGYAERARAP